MIMEYLAKVGVVSYKGKFKTPWRIMFCQNLQNHIWDFHKRHYLMIKIIYHPVTYLDIYIFCFAYLHTLDIFPKNWEGGIVFISF